MHLYTAQVMITRYKSSQLIFHAPNKKKANAKVDDMQRVRSHTWSPCGGERFPRHGMPLGLMFWSCGFQILSLSLSIVSSPSCWLFMSLDNIFRKLFIISLVSSLNAYGGCDENTCHRRVSLPSSTNLCCHRACGAKAPPGKCFERIPTSHVYSTVYMSNPAIHVRKS